MIKFININKKKPFRIFSEKYNEAMLKNQQHVEAMSIASFNKETGEVDQRYVNCKFILDESFIFFSNYSSNKAKQFETYNVISAAFFWPKINLQIRMKAKITKVSEEFSKNYFKSRSIKKNAIAISSDQSQEIKSFDLVQEKYNKSLINDNLLDCPSYWGGYQFKPYYIEYWKGNKNRLNERNVYKKSDEGWKNIILQP